MSHVSRSTPKHSVPSRQEFTQRILAWCDLMDSLEQFLLAGLRRKIGPDGDLEAAYREWYQRQMEERDKAILKRSTVAPKD